MSFIRRVWNKLTGKTFDPQIIAEELFSERSYNKRAKKNQKTDDVIKAAVENPTIANLMAEIEITEEHVRDVYRRIMIDGDNRMAIRAINNPEILRWYYVNGGKEMFLSENQALELLFFAQGGKCEK